MTIHRGMGYEILSIMWQKPCTTYRHWNLAEIAADAVLHDTPQVDTVVRTLRDASASCAGLTDRQEAALL